MKKVQCLCCVVLWCGYEFIVQKKSHWLTLLLSWQAIVGKYKNKRKQRKRTIVILSCVPSKWKPNILELIYKIIIIFGFHNIQFFNVFANSISTLIYTHIFDFSSILVFYFYFSLHHLYMVNEEAKNKKLLPHTTHTSLSINLF